MAPRAFHVMTKPAGPLCNLGCRYCFYLEKRRALYPDVADFRMRDEVLEEYIRQYIAAQTVPEISFAWQGGEPTLLGRGFFERVVELQRKYLPPGKTVTNAFQTNGLLLDSPFCKFLKENRFLVGLSVDGPGRLHDANRLDQGGKPSFARVARGMEMLKRHRVEFNTLTVVSRANSRDPLEVYRFLRDYGSGFMQFIPLVEREGDGTSLAGPPALDGSGPERPVTDWAVEPGVYGDFLCAVFDEWVSRDVGRYFVQSFDVHLAAWMGIPASLCVFSETCGKAMALEHNGDLFSCDHFVYASHRLGNIMEKPVEELAESSFQAKFGNDKRDALPRFCRECSVRFACNGECPKHRFRRTPDGEPGLNYLCPGLKRFFKHVDPYMRRMAELLKAGQPASSVMTMASRGARGR